MSKTNDLRQWVLWKGELKPTTCDACKARIGKVYNKDRLTVTPPLHPNCGCELMPLAIPRRGDSLKELPQDKNNSEIDKRIKAFLEGIFGGAVDRFKGLKSVVSDPAKAFREIMELVKNDPLGFARNHMLNTVIDPFNFYRIVYRIMQDDFGGAGNLYSQNVIEAAGVLASAGLGRVAGRVAGRGAGRATERTSWWQSEIDVGRRYRGYAPQRSFLNGEIVPRGTRGSVRPDYFREGGFLRQAHSIEVKNYNLMSASGQNNLIHNVSRQVNQRVNHLPQGTRQTIRVDVRGQTLTRVQENAIRKRILQKCNIDVEIKFESRG